jgi:hypothetical protein
MPVIEINSNIDCSLINMSKCCNTLRDCWTQDLEINVKKNTVSYKDKHIDKCPFCGEEIKMYRWYKKLVGPKV